MRSIDQKDKYNSHKQHSPAKWEWYHCLATLVVYHVMFCCLSCYSCCLTRSIMLLQLWLHYRVYVKGDVIFVKTSWCDKLLQNVYLLPTHLLLDSSHTLVITYHLFHLHHRHHNHLYYQKIEETVIVNKMTNKIIIFL